jgi:endogenous inhibitor of DNA gyrase (YacG/DUF329 family)
LRAAALIAEVFFRERITRQHARCPRCGKDHQVRAGVGPSPRRFCSDCSSYIEGYLSGWDEAGYRVANRRAARKTQPATMAEALPASTKGAA